MTEDIREYACIACGHCGYSCPPAHHRKAFSPRLFVEQHRQGRFEQMDLWSCMTCSACAEICPENVDFPSFMRAQRAKRRKDSLPVRTHAGMIDSMRDLDATGKGAGRRFDWLADDLQIDDDSEVALFVGCLPMLDVIFKDIRPDLLDIPRSAIRLLNLMGIRPRLLTEERCCGHDAYWLGDMETFQRLAGMNREAFACAGVKEIVTVCPECSHTLSSVYDKEIGPSDVRVRHISLLADEAVKNGILKFDKTPMKMTYQDPCRLGRHSGIFDEPRDLIRQMAILKEMPRHGPL
ncbi:MAG TPA: (Fe-S)-binding protein, partial [Methanomassiliicoccales archaeon]|nr:(Fe-S)-binding protein [Methanomassiliicoccales archaeon]